MINLKIKRVAIVGASSQIGARLLPILTSEGIDIFPIVRSKDDVNPNNAYAFDAEQKCFSPPLDNIDAVISLAPLPVIGAVLKMCEALKVKRLIAFGSTGRFTKVDSSSLIEQNFVRQQEASEQELILQCKKLGIYWTLFRPTMIYGADMDLNVAFIKSMIHRFGFFPIPWGANGLRQPVHVDDLAIACVSALSCSNAFNKAFNLGGGEVISYPNMVIRIFEHEKKFPLLISIPLGFFKVLIKLINLFDKYKFVRQEMVIRMFDDLVVDNSSAKDSFGYFPREFYKT